VVGHDWGAIVAWIAAMRHPERVEKLAILNVPHPARFPDGLMSPMQLLRSSYAFFFQIPRLPEEVIRAGDFALLRSVLAWGPGTAGYVQRGRRPAVRGSDFAAGSAHRDHQLLPGPPAEPERDAGTAEKNRGSSARDMG
jgi:pimeloyl-ACP methyl ester carboxylesterase